MKNLTAAFQRRISIVAIITSIAVCASPLLQAQGLEEVLVTATKREVGLQDVPISISVMSGESIQEQGIGEPEELTVFMPNVHVAEGGAGTQLRLNMAAFYSENDELQVSTFDGNCCFNVGNAASSEVKGVEIDFTAGFRERLTPTGAVAYLDATYDSFTDVACNVHQTVDGP